MADTLKEYLIKLGFDVSPAAYKKFNDSLESVKKLTLRTSAAVAGIAVAAEAMVERYAGSMARLHYLSQRTGASVKNLKGIEFAFEQIGLTADGAAAAVESMVTAIKLAPGLKELVRDLGVNPDQDSRDVMVGLLGKLKEISDRGDFNVAAAYGENFGWSPQMLQQVFANFKDLNDAIKKHSDLVDKTSQDQEKAAKNFAEFTKVVGELRAQLALLGGTLAGDVLPHFKEFNTVMREFVKDIQAGEFNTWFERAAAVFWVLGNAVQGLANSFKALGEAWDNLKSGNILEGLKAFGRSHTSFWSSIFSPESAAERDANEALRKDARRGPGGAVSGRIGGPPAGGAGSPTAGAGNSLIDAIIRQESRGNQGAISPRGAIGTMQVMPGTGRDMARQLGIPFSLQRLMTDARYNVQLGTEYLNTMLKRYSGNQTLALAAYNAGPKTVDQWLKDIGDPRTGTLSDAEFTARVPYSEMRNYVRDISAATSRSAGAGGGVTFHQSNTFTITGGDADANGRAVAGALRGANADLTRNLQGPIDAY